MPQITNFGHEHPADIVRLRVTGGFTTQPDPATVVQMLLNNAVVALEKGDVVVIDPTADEAVTTTTTAQDTHPAGIAQDDIAAGETGPILTEGYADYVNVTAAVTRGRYAETSTTAKKATENATRRAGSFAVFLTSGSSPSALLFGAADSSTAGASPLIVKDEGVALATAASSLDFVGAGVTATGAGAAKTITIPGGGGPAGAGPYPTLADYGAIGDGSADDTAAVLAAVAALDEYDTIFCPKMVTGGPTIFAVDARIDLPRAIRFLGPSAYPNPDTSPDGGVILRQMANNTTLLNQTAIKRLGVENIALENAGTNASGKGIYALGSVAMRHILVRDFYDNLFVDGVSGGSYLSTIDESFFHAAGRANIYLDGKVNNFRMRGGYISTGPYSLYASGGIFGLLLKGVAIESYTSAGIYIDGRASSQDTDSVSLEDLYMDVVAGTAPDIRIGATNTVYGVRIINPHIERGTAGQTHISVNKVNRIQVEGGYIRSNASNVSIAIDATNGSNVVLVPGKWDGAYSTMPASTEILDPATSVTPAAVGTASAVGGSKYLADASHVHAGAPYGADYLVGTAQAGLSSEIVVGTTPGGELGGTWDTPTVDTTHSGSSHADAIATAEAYADAAILAAVPAGLHAHVAGETHLSDGSTTTYTLDEQFEPGSVEAFNTTTLAYLVVTEAQPDQATVSAAGSSGDKITFSYAATVA